jgi:hypothetical protein
MMATKSDADMGSSSWLVDCKISRETVKNEKKKRRRTTHDKLAVGAWL